MPEYYCYLLDDEGHILQRQIISADDDANSLRMGRELFLVDPFEVWCMGRMIGSVARGETLPVLDAKPKASDS